MPGVLPTVNSCCDTCDDQVSVLVPGAAGAAGADGADGADGINAYTTLTSGFVVPAVNANVTIEVTESRWMAPGQKIFIQNAGYYQFVSSTSSTNATVMNLGYTGNAAPAAAVASANKISPAGATGPTGPAGTSGTGVLTVGADLDPNSIVTGSVGDMYKSSVALGGDGSFWIKTSGTATNTGWEA